MASSVLPCVVQSCAGASPGGLFRSSSSRDGQGQGQAPVVLGRVSMTPPSSLGRHRKQQQQQQVAAAGEPWSSADPPLRRLVAPPSSLTVPVAGEWLERGGRSPDLPVVHYCNANIVQGSRGGSADGCIHIRGMSESSTPNTPPVPQQRRHLSSSGDASTVTASPSSPAVSRPGRSPASRDALVQGRALRPNDSGAARRGQLVDDGGQLYDIDAIMRELAVDVERIVDSAPSSGRLVDQSVQTSNVAPASIASAHHHHHPHTVFTRIVDRTHLPPGAADMDHRPRRTASHAATSAAVMQPLLGAVNFSSAHEPSRPMNLTRSNGVISNNVVANDSRRSFGVADASVGALAAHRVVPKISPPPLLPPPTHESR